MDGTRLIFALHWLIATVIQLLVWVIILQAIRSRLIHFNPGVRPDHSVAAGHKRVQQGLQPFNRKICLFAHRQKQMLASLAAVFHHPGFPYRRRPAFP